MADFKTHITISSLCGAAYGSAGFLLFDLPLEHCLIATGLCSLAGMLPDLDSNSSVPVREMLSFVAVLVPVLMLPRFRALGFTPEMIVLATATLYLVIRFGLGAVFKRYTVHRGMWHSIPAAVIAGMVTFEVCLSSDMAIRLFKSWAVVLGFISHLVLDEVYSVDLRGRRIKRSFGTAMKFFSRNRWANISTYAKLVLLGLLIAGDPLVMERVGHEPLDIPWSPREWLHSALLDQPADAAPTDTAPSDTGPVDVPPTLWR